MTWALTIYNHQGTREHHPAFIIINIIFIRKCLNPPVIRALCFQSWSPDPEKKMIVTKVSWLSSIYHNYHQSNCHLCHHDHHQGTWHLASSPSFSSSRTSPYWADWILSELVWSSSWKKTSCQNHLQNPPIINDRLHLHLDIHLGEPDDLLLEPLHLLRPHGRHLNQSHWSPEKTITLIFHKTVVITLDGEILTIWWSDDQSTRLAWPYQWSAGTCKRVTSGFQDFRISGFQVKPAGDRVSRGSVLGMITCLEYHRPPSF